MKYLFILLVFIISCKSAPKETPIVPKVQDTTSVVIDSATINTVIDLINQGLIQVDSCGVQPVDGTIVIKPHTEEPKLERIKGRNERKLARINRRFDLKESKVEARKIIDSIRIITKVVYDTVKIKSIENVKVEKVEAKQAIKETRIEQSWKKWLIVGGFVFLFLLIIVYLILKRYKLI